MSVASAQPISAGTSNPNSPPPTQKDFLEAIKNGKSDSGNVTKVSAPPPTLNASNGTVIGQTKDGQNVYVPKNIPTNLLSDQQKQQMVAKAQAAEDSKGASPIPTSS